MSVIALPDSRAALPLVAPNVRRTPILTSRTLSEETGFDARLKAELFQRTGSYKIRGPLVKLARLSPAERDRGVVCSSAGNHAQGVALAAALLGVRAVVCMAANATPSKIEATRGYGAEVVLRGSIWDEADEKARELVESEGLTYVHPFDDLDLISGQSRYEPATRRSPMQSCARAGRMGGICATFAATPIRCRRFPRTSTSSTPLTSATSSLPSGRVSSEPRRRARRAT